MKNQSEYRETKGLLFSIIVPIYQIKEYLKESIESILKQDADNYEIILADDGSTDGSAEICDKYSAENATISVIHQKNAGLSVARNSGIKVAKGDYIVLLDGDDKLCVNALKSLRDYIYDNDFPDVVSHRRMSFNDNGDEENYPYLYDEYIGHFNSNAEAFVKFQNMPTGNMGAWNFTVKRDYIIRNNLFFYEGIFHEDEEWVPRILLSGGRIRFSDIVFYGYRTDREGSITKILNIKRLCDKLFIIDHLQNLFSDSSFEIRESIQYRCCSLLFGIICQLQEYKQIQGYHEVASEVKDKTQLLRQSAKKSHKIAYISVRTIGLNKTASILYLLSKRRRDQK